MAFTFGNTASFGNQSSNAATNQQQQSADLEEITTNMLSFKAIAAEAKVRLFPSPWPAGALPPSTASLLAIAPRQGLLAAAGPSSVVIASTEMVRQAYTAASSEIVRPFTPQLTIELGMRVSQIAFSANEEYLVLSAETGGGLAVYLVQSILQGNTQSSFELPTNGAAVRALLPNPTAEKAELLAVVTTSGHLLMANLKSRQLLSGSQGQSLKENVSCVAWSNKGKQLVAGLGDGTCCQMTPEGEAKASIPSPPGIDGAHYVSSILWLENDLFLAVYTPTASDGDLPPEPTYCIVTRDKISKTAFQFQRLQNLSPPFAQTRSPPSQFLLRLKDFAPNLSDVIIVSSTASPDISLATRSRVALDMNMPADRITDVFTTTSFTDDSRRAQLPMSDSMADTSVVGMSLDLSVKEKVKRPISGEEFEESQGPLPALMVLNEEGVLSTWWIVYNESVKQGITYHGLTSAMASKPVNSNEPAISGPASSQQSAGLFAKGISPSTPFGAPNGGTGGAVFGTPATMGSAFGAPSIPGQNRSVWSGGAGNAVSSATKPVFGQSTFGSSPSTGFPAQANTFGVAGGLGNRASPWTTAGTASTTGAFGQPSQLGSQTPAFSSTAVSQSKADQNPAATSASPFGGFASFATKPSGFLSATSTAQPSQGLFGKSSTSTPFLGGDSTPSSFGQASNDTKNIFQSSGTGFQLGSTFKADATAQGQSENMKAPQASDGGLFGSTFGSALGQVVQTTSKDADMNDDADREVADSNEDSRSKPAQAITSTKSGSSATTFQFQSLQPDGPSGGPPHVPAKQSSLTKSQGVDVQSPMPTKEEAMPANSRPSPSNGTEAVNIKKEPEEEHNDLRLSKNKEARTHDVAPDNSKTASQSLNGPQTPTPAKQMFENPLPPESTSKTTYALGESSSSSKSSDETGYGQEHTTAKSKLSEVQASASDQGSPFSEERNDAGDLKTSDKGDQELEDDDFSDEYESDDDRKEHESEENPDEGSQGDDTHDDEGSGIVVAHEISPSISNQSSKITPTSSFEPNTTGSPINSIFSTATKGVATTKDRPTLFGEINKSSTPFFPLPQKSFENQRSPSPQRAESRSDALRSETARSVSAPGLPQQRNAPKMQANRTEVPITPYKSEAHARRQEQDRLLADYNRRAAEEQQKLEEDDGQDYIQELLQSQVEGTKILDPFLAHQDYIGKVDKPGIPGQIEKVFRDINSMVDTLGLNARSLTAFVKGQSQGSEAIKGRREDLEHIDEWCLLDIESLGAIEDDIAQQLQENELQDNPATLHDVSSCHQSFERIQHTAYDLGRIVEQRKDPAATERAQEAPLSLDQKTQLRDLRKGYSQFQTQLSEAERALSEMRAKLTFVASQANGHVQNDPVHSKQPTVQAVERTISKMTAMARNKQSNIDELESQMQQLGFSTPSPKELASRTLHSRECSPFALGTPLSAMPSKRISKFLPNNATSQPNFSASITTTASPFKDSPLRRLLDADGSLTNVATGNGDTKREPSDIAKEEIGRYKAAKQRRRQVNETIVDVFGNRKAGIKIRQLD